MTHAFANVATMAAATTFVVGRMTSLVTVALFVGALMQGGSAIATTRLLRLVILEVVLCKGPQRARVGRD